MGSRHWGQRGASRPWCSPRAMASGVMDGPQGVRWLRQLTVPRRRVVRQRSQMKVILRTTPDERVQHRQGCDP